MDRQMEQKERMQIEKRRTRLLIVVAAMVLVCGLFAQISVRAQVSARAKEVAAMQAQVRLMSAEAQNLTNCISQHHNLEAIGLRAAALGMTPVQEGQMRRVVLPAANTSTQTVANIDGEEING